MADEQPTYAVTNEAEAEAAEQAVAAYRIAVRNEKFAPLREIVNSAEFETHTVGFQEIMNAGTFDDDPHLSVLLKNIVMLMTNLHAAAQ